MSEWFKDGMTRQRMNSTKLSIIGEAKVLERLVFYGFDVFTQFSGKEPFDLVAHKFGKLYRISVKSTSSTTVYLRRI